MKLNAGHIELAVAKLIGYRRHTIVPNVSWGLGLNHECDLLVLDEKGRLTEIEIKISKSDLKADFKKMHGHTSNIISRLIYAVPVEMEDYTLTLIPKNAGLISVKHYEQNNRILCFAHWVRRCVHDKNKDMPDRRTLEKLYQLGCMRIWSLKQHNIK
jgi:hypothetical protein